MKRYKIEMDKDAAVEATEAASFIAQNSPLNAARWLAGLEKAIESLKVMPNRCGMARENEFLDDELRQYIYKSYRIIFRVDDASGLVRILHIRHAARQAIGENRED